MTVSEVKRDLPDVPVKIGRKVHYAKLSGRLLPFATVTLSHVHHGKGYLRGPAWRDWQFAWETVARAITDGRPLLVD